MYVIREEKKERKEGGRRVRKEERKKERKGRKEERKERNERRKKEKKKESEGRRADLYLSFLESVNALPSQRQSLIVDKRAFYLVSTLKGSIKTCSVDMSRKINIGSKRPFFFILTP